MHYCQTCQARTLMEPRGLVAMCPHCGAQDMAAIRRPLIVVVGASGSGKSAIVADLLRELAGTAAVFDVDWLIDPLDRKGDIDWSVFRDLWLHIAHGVAQNGLPTVLLAPFIPEHLERLPGRSWVGPLHFVVVDCPDDIRRARLAARPRWRARDVDAQLDFARWLREHLGPVVDTSVGTPADVAAVVAARVRHVLS